MYDAMQQAIARYRLVQPGEGVLVAVSGGQDSLALLHALLRVAPSLRLRVCAAHVEHGIRGQASRMDAAFVRRLCGEWGVPFCMRAVDAPGQAAAQGENLEQTARELRYTALLEMMGQCGCDKVATAHHQDDQAETLLLRLLRGSGPQGLTGIQPARADGVIRPLLLADKVQIRAYCQAWRIPHREDATNADVRYARNYLRHRVLPLLCEINPAAPAAIARAAQALQVDADLLHTLEQQAYGDCVTGKRLDCAAVAALHPALRARVLAEYAGMLGVKELSEQRLRALEALVLLGRQGAVVQLHGLSLRREYGGILPDAPHAVRRQRCYACAVPGETQTQEGTLTATPWALADCAPGESPNVQYMDADALPTLLTLRCRRTGDTIHPLGAPGHRSLKKYLIDKKIPAHQREELWILAKDGEVYWVIGQGISQKAALTFATRRAVRLEWRPEKSE